MLNVQDGEDITVKLNTLLAQARDKATDEKQCKVIVPPGNYTLTGTLHMYSNIYLYAEGATITKTSPQKKSCSVLAIHHRNLQADTRIP